MDAFYGAGSGLVQGLTNEKSSNLEVNNAIA